MRLPLLRRPKGEQRPDGRPKRPLLIQRDIRDFIAPDGFDLRDLRSLRAGDRFVRTLAVTGLPRFLSPDWLLPFLEHEGDLDLSIHIFPYDDREAIKKLTTMIAKVKAAAELQGGNLSMAAELQAAEQDLWQLRERVMRNISRIAHTLVAVNLYSRSPQDLEDKAASLGADLAARRVHTRVPEGMTGEAYRTVAPLGRAELAHERYWHTLDTGALSMCFPFVMADILHPGGVPLGINLHTGLLVFVDAFHVRPDGRPALPNKNMIIYASSGSGKTAFARMYAGRAAAVGERWVILDPEGVYSSMAEVLGGVYFRVGDPRYRFNPCEVEPDEDAEGGMRVDLRSKRQDLLQLYGAMLGGLDPAEEAILDEAAAEEYAARGITEDPDSLWMREPREEGGRYLHGRRKKPMPRLSDIQKRVEAKKDRLSPASRAKLLEGMRLYLEGGPLDFFDCESNLDLSAEENRIIVFDLSLLEENRARPLGMHVVLSWVWEKFVKRRPEWKKRVVVDEAQMFADHPDTMKFLDTMARRCRKRNAGLTVISQDYHKLHANQTTRSIHSNTCMYLFLKQAPVDVAALAEAFRLSQGEQDFLLKAEPGRGILRIDLGRHVERVALQAVPLPAEQAWVFQEARRS